MKKCEAQKDEIICLKTHRKARNETQASVGQTVFGNMGWKMLAEGEMLCVGEIARKTSTLLSGKEVRCPQDPLCHKLGMFTCLVAS